MKGFGGFWKKGKFSFGLMAGLVRAAVLATVLMAFTFALLAEPLYADHDCSGEDCVVCLLVDAARNTLRSLDKMESVPLVLAAFLFAPVFLFSFISLNLRIVTPVVQKVRANE